MKNCINKNCRHYLYSDEVNCKVMVDIESCEFHDILEPEDSVYHKKNSESGYDRESKINPGTNAG